MRHLRSFASDNTSGAHPEVLDALARANAGAARAYGEDALTGEALLAFQERFGAGARPWFVLLGTAANVLGIKSMVRSHHGVFCAETAHLATDECGAPEAAIGCKLLPLPSRQGKIRVEDCLPALAMRGDVHRTFPRVLSITQMTECGTLYSLEELRTIRTFCREHDLFLHMDGARLCNAAAALGCPLRALTADVGVDVLSFGGTKNGLLFGEAVVFFNDALGNDFGYIRKQHMQLTSKMRFLAAQFLAYFNNDLWLRNAGAANAMAALLAEKLRAMDHVRIAYPVEGNAVFIRLHKNAIAKLLERFYFYVLDSSDADGFPKDWHLVRLMTSFNTSEEQVLEFAEAVRCCGPI